MPSTLNQLHSLGQSLWYDNIQRGLLENGELAAMIEHGEIRGVTSNPSIFNNAIANTGDYDSALVPLAWAGWNAEQIYEQLALEDIRLACDLFLPLYHETSGGDGYVSLEVSPRLAHDTAATLSDAERLWAAVNRPNLMIKIPATPQGIPAVRQAIAAGINVNVTLIFSLARYRQVMDAFLSGLENRIAAGLPVNSMASVASFFVSRMDTKLDPRLAALGSPLAGQLANANAKLAYQEFRGVFEGPRFAALAAKGARLQRPLWASTSTKNPKYSPTIYVDNLIGPHTVNTVPPQTLGALRKDGKVELTLETGLEEARRAFDDLATLGISIDAMTQELEDEGVQRFAADYDSLLRAIDVRRQAALDDLGPLAGAVTERVAKIEEEAIPARLWAHDASLWTNDPKGQDEIRRRLGWLDLPERDAVVAHVAQSGAEESRPYAEFAAEIRGAGYEHVLLLGMGGSSLAPEVMSLVFSLEAGGSPLPIEFAILDSTDPAQVLATARKFPAARTLFIVSSKSGGTAEVNAFLDYFWARARRSVGEFAADHFVAITDPGTSLDKLAQARKFRYVFHGDPTVGGRFSVLSPFGLIPASLMGVDVERMLDSAAKMMRQCTADVPAARNPGIALGIVLAEAALHGRDKVTLFADPQWASFGSWLEQLVAESSGKNGMGIIPVDGEPPAAPEFYGPDRLFVYLRSTGKHDAAIALLRKAGFPVLVYPLADGYALGTEFYRWEYATAVACAVMGVNAFEQPDVQDNKTRTLNKIEAYRKAGALEAGEFVSPGPHLRADLKEFLSQGKAGDYVAFNAYLPRNQRTSAQLTELRTLIRAKTGLATTVGFGPRFLHSTGQLHKGGADNGLFLQITADPVTDAAIPEEMLTFGALERAQALGDFEALEARGRRLLRVHLPNPAALAEVIEAAKQL